MSNFDLKKYLVENKATFVSKLLSEESVSENMGLAITYPEARAMFKAMELGGVPVDDFETMGKLQIEKFIEDNVETIYNTLGKMKSMVSKLGIDENTFNVIFDTIEKLYKGEIAYIAVSKVLK